MKESSFEKKCIKELQNLPYSYWPPKGEPGSSRGVPDRIGCVRGKYVALEFKRSLKEVLAKSNGKAMQAYTVTQVQEAGGYGTFVCPETWPQIYQKIKELSHG
jgi:hypothetical protein